MDRAHAEEFARLVQELKEHPEIPERAMNLAAHIARKKYGKVLFQVMRNARQLIHGAGHQLYVGFTIEQKDDESTVTLWSRKEDLAKLNNAEITAVLRTASSVGRMFERLGMKVNY